MPTSGGSKGGANGLLATVVHVARFQHTVIDPHAEYARALGSASVRSVLAEGNRRLRVPYWALPAADIVRIFAGTSGGATFANRFDLVVEARRKFVEDVDWLSLDPTTITVDTPVPFDIRPVWYKLDYENHETREVTAKGFDGPVHIHRVTAIDGSYEV